MGGKKLGDVSLLDFAPTVLKVMDVPIPDNMKGKIIGEAI